MSTKEKTELTRSVIVRAYGNEPVQLRMLSIRNGIVEVVGADESKSMGFVADIVYPFDPSLFEQLKGAYNMGDTGSLTQLWQKARSYRSLSE